jgi:hypothetical protein
MQQAWRVFVVLAFLLSASFSPAMAETAKASDPPMTVVIVRNASTECEPVCPQWIAAEGRITGATPAVFRKAISAMGKQKLPILIQSSGGDVQASLEIGRLIRKRGLDVAVGWTLFRDDCKPGIKNCKLPVDQKGVYAGLGFSNRSYCNSACLFVLASGTKRMSSLGAGIGAHQILTNWTRGDTVYYREKYRIVNHKKKIISRTITKRVKGKSYTTNGLYKGLRKQLTTYLNAMGVDLALFDDMDKAPPTSIYWMPLAEQEKIKLINSKVEGDQLASIRACKIYPLPSHCIFKIPPTAKP